MSFVSKSTPDCGAFYIYSKFDERIAKYVKHGLPLGIFDTVLPYYEDANGLLHFSSLCEYVLQPVSVVKSSPSAAKGCVCLETVLDTGSFLKFRLEADSVVRLLQGFDECFLPNEQLVDFAVSTLSFKLRRVANLEALLSDQVRFASCADLEDFLLLLEKQFLQKKKEFLSSLQLPAVRSSVLAESSFALLSSEMFYRCSGLFDLSAFFKDESSTVMLAALGKWCAFLSVSPAGFAAAKKQALSYFAVSLPDFAAVSDLPGVCSEDSWRVAALKQCGLLVDFWQESLLDAMSVRSVLFSEKFFHLPEFSDRVLALFEIYRVNTQLGDLFWFPELVFNYLLNTETIGGFKQKDVAKHVSLSAEQVETAGRLWSSDGVFSSLGAVVETVQALV